MAPANQSKASKQSKRKKHIKTKSKYFSNPQQDKAKRIKKRAKTDGGKVATLPHSSIKRVSVNSLNPKQCTNRLGRTFFDSPTELLAVALLGKLLCRENKGEKMYGRIVETEAYLGEIDAACHSYGGRRTAKNEAMYGVPGTAYVYFIYGLYHCFNISSQEKGACVLVRALEPVKGLGTMRMLRDEKRKVTTKPLKDHEITNGPSKLCIAMNIDKTLNNMDMVTSECFWVEEDVSPAEEIKVVHSTRIGISSYGTESANKPYRYYTLGNKCVSNRDKVAEKKLETICENM